MTETPNSQVLVDKNLEWHFRDDELKTTVVATEDAEENRESTLHSKETFGTSDSVLAAKPDDALPATTVDSQMPLPTTATNYTFRSDGIPTLEQRRELRAMPVESRPYRPLHFYGNTVRRRMGR